MIDKINKNNAIGYRRLSDRDQSNYSLSDQDKSIKDYCRFNGLNLIAMYTDNGECSDSFDRADYKALEAFIKKHIGQAQYLIIKDHDRFSRNLPEALMKINELQDKYGIKVLATDENVDLDTHDPDVFIQRAFKYLMANQELLRIRKRTKDGIRQAQSQGRFVNVAPFGFLNARDESGRGILLIDDEKAAVVRFIFEEYLLGTPIFIIYQEARKMGFNRTGNSAIHNLLKNYVYAGLVKVNGDRKTKERLIKGLHQPIISEADYWLVQEKLGNKRPQKTQPREDFPLRGILKCWCGKSMTAGFSKGKKKYYLYYRCLEHTETNIPGEALHSKFEELLDILSLNERQIAFIIKKSNSLLKLATKDSQDILVAREKQLKEIEARIDKLEVRLMEDEIDGKTYKKWLRKFEQDRALLYEEIESANRTNSSDKWAKLQRLLPLMTSIKSIYRSAPLNRRQTLIKGVFKHSLVYSNGTFRTPSIEKSLACNLLKAKEKGLLEVEEADDLWDKIPSSTAYGSRTRHSTVKGWRINRFTNAAFSKKNLLPFFEGTKVHAFFED